MLSFNSFAFAWIDKDTDVKFDVAVVIDVGVAIDANGYTITVIEDTRNYQKIKIIDNGTQKIETLEAFKKGK